MTINNFIVPFHFNCTQEEFSLIKSREYISITCTVCSKPFERMKKNILKHYVAKESLSYYCSNRCQAEEKSRNAYSVVNCINCNSSFKKLNSQLKKAPNSFCNSSCAASYNNKNKDYGYRRSKLEVYLEEQLSNLYPNIELVFGSKQIIRI